MGLIKNMEPEHVLNLAQQVAVRPGEIVSRTLAQNRHVSLTLFAFAKGEEISTHESNGDAMVLVLEGTGKFTVDGQEYLVHAGETLIMPAKKPHAVFGQEEFKMLLTVVFPSEKQLEKANGYGGDKWIIRCFVISVRKQQDVAAVPEPVSAARQQMLLICRIF